MTLKMTKVTCAALLLAASSFAAPAFSSSLTANGHGQIKTDHLKFDWLRTSQTAANRGEMTPRQRAVLMAYTGAMGKGTWVCSPAGSGKKSRCYAR